MDFDECPVCNGAPHMWVVTVDDDQVRMLGMWFAAKEGFYFPSANVKAVYRQLTANPKVELCFYAPPARCLAREERWTLEK